MKQEGADEEFFSFGWWNWMDSSNDFAIRVFYSFFPFSLFLIKCVMLRYLVVKVLSSTFILFVEFEVSFKNAELALSTFQSCFFVSWLELHSLLVFSMNWQPFNGMRVFMHSKLKDPPAGFRTTHVPSILEIEDFIMIDDCFSIGLKFEVCTVKAFVNVLKNVLDGAD
jgi:hypothetical protein